MFEDIKTVKDPTSAELSISNKNWMLIIYILFMVGVVFFSPIMWLIAFIIVRYVKWQNFAQTTYESHANYLMRTFWISLIAGIVGVLTIWALYLGWLILFCNWIWCIYRVVRGFIRMGNGHLA